MTWSIHPANAYNAHWWKPEPFGAPHLAYWYEDISLNKYACLAVGKERAAYMSGLPWRAWVDISLGLSLEEMQKVVEVSLRLRG